MGVRHAFCMTIAPKGRRHDYSAYDNMFWQIQQLCDTFNKFLKGFVLHMDDV
jgi:hypothetical protein